MKNNTKHSVHHHSHFLTHLHKHHTHILSYNFWLVCYRPDRLKMAILFKLNLKYTQNSVLERRQCIISSVTSQSWLTYTYTRKGTSWIVEESFDAHVCGTVIDIIQLSSYVRKKKRESKREELRRWTKSKFHVQFSWHPETLAKLWEYFLL